MLRDQANEIAELGFTCLFPSIARPRSSEENHVATCLDASALLFIR
jgi:hypothetical protein